MLIRGVSTLSKAQDAPSVLALALIYTEQEKAKKTSKTKYTCPTCAQNAWAKPGALLICGICYEDGESKVNLMLAESR
jgi:hypothetical protein